VLVANAGSTANVEELHLVALHMVCAAVDVALGIAPSASSAGFPLPCTA